MARGRRRGRGTTAAAVAPVTKNKTISDYYTARSPAQADDVENNGVNDADIGAAKMHRNKRSDVLSPSRMGNIVSSPRTPNLSSVTKALALSPTADTTPTSPNTRALASLRTLSPTHNRASHHVFGGKAVIGSPLSPQKPVIGSLSPQNAVIGGLVSKAPPNGVVGPPNGLFNLNPRQRLFKDDLKLEKREAGPLVHTPPPKVCPSPRKHAKTHLHHTTRKDSAKSLSDSFNEMVNTNGVTHNGFLVIKSEDEGDECSIIAEVSSDNNDKIEAAQQTRASRSLKVLTPSQTAAVKSDNCAATPKPSPTMLHLTQNRLSHYSPTSNSTRTPPGSPLKAVSQAPTPPVSTAAIPAPVRRSARQMSRKNNVKENNVSNTQQFTVEEFDDDDSDEKPDLEDEKAAPVKEELKVVPKVTKIDSGKKETESKPVNGIRKDAAITEFFPAARRAVRKSAKEIKREEELQLQLKIKEKCEEGLEVVEFPLKGRGVVTTQEFRKGEFVVEYVGDLLNGKEAREREEVYAQDPSKGCYMYYFACGGERWCLDGTAESGYLGRLVNHSRLTPNLVTRAVMVAGAPHLVLVAARDLPKGVELLYDYGDRSKEALANHPWLAY